MAYEQRARYGLVTDLLAVLTAYGMRDKENDHAAEVTCGTAYARVAASVAPAAAACADDAR